MKMIQRNNNFKKSYLFEYKLGPFIIILLLLYYIIMTCTNLSAQTECIWYHNLLIIIYFLVKGHPHEFFQGGARKKKEISFDWALYNTIIIIIITISLHPIFSDIKAKVTLSAECFAIQFDHCFHISPTGRTANLVS